jgi:hypothetical protein
VPTLLASAIFSPIAWRLPEGYGADRPGLRRQGPPCSRRHKVSSTNSPHLLEHLANRELEMAVLQRIIATYAR